MSGIVAPENCVHMLTTGTWEYVHTSIGRKGLHNCDQVKNLEMRSCWVNRMGPKSNDKCQEEKSDLGSRAA